MWRECTAPDVPCQAIKKEGKSVEEKNISGLCILVLVFTPFLLRLRIPVSRRGGDESDLMMQ